MFASFPLKFYLNYKVSTEIQGLLSTFKVCANPVILEISATYRLVSYLLANNYLIYRLRAQCMISKANINSGS